uniref:Acidic protein n=1 Tax=Leersia perrieri TaxID=77586 RepID=A0A0D9VBS8_9ORYZ
MEVKKVAVIAVCCMVILLFSGQKQQVTAKPKICRCYHECLPNCGLRKSRSFCKMFCGGCCVMIPTHNCTSIDAIPITGDDCRMICLNSFCGEAATSQWQNDADAAGCVDDCNNYRRGYGKIT